MHELSATATVSTYLSRFGVTVVHRGYYNKQATTICDLVAASRASCALRDNLLKQIHKKSCIDKMDVVGRVPTPHHDAGQPNEMAIIVFSQVGAATPLFGSRMDCSSPHPLGLATWADPSHQRRLMRQCNVMLEAAQRANRLTILWT
jgi:hypothetical protein